MADFTEARRLFDENKGYALAFGRNMYRGWFSSSHDRADCDQEVLLCLWKAALVFDATRGLKFATLFCTHIRNRISTLRRYMKQRGTAPLADIYAQPEPFELSEKQEALLRRIRKATEYLEPYHKRLIERYFFESRCKRGEPHEWIDQLAAEWGEGKGRAISGCLNSALNRIRSLVTAGGNGRTKCKPEDRDELLGYPLKGLRGGLNSPRQTAISLSSVRQASPRSA